MSRPAGNMSAAAVTIYFTSNTLKEHSLELLSVALCHRGITNFRRLQAHISTITSARLSPPSSGGCCAEGGHERQWLHSLALAAALLERIPSARVRIAGASGSITCAEDLSRQLIMPAIQHRSAAVR